MEAKAWKGFKLSLDLIAFGFRLEGDAVEQDDGNENLSTRDAIGSGVAGVVIATEARRQSG